MESEFIDWLRPRAPTSSAVLVGIGDDAALLDLPSQRCVVTSDMLMDGVDFVLDQVDPRRVGRKALAVNLSDLAAMAARPVAVIVSIAVPRHAPLSLPQSLYAGLIELAEEYQVALAGGDTNRWEHPLAISVTAIGEPTERGVLRRSGARPGDAIVVTGEFGGSILGRHFDFTPRVTEVLALHRRYELHAGIDVSDGLSLDLSRLAQESGCGAMIVPQAIPISPAAVQFALQRNDGSTPLDHALGDGEDFELILAVPADQAERLLAEQPFATRLTKIGEFVAEPGLWQVDAQGNRAVLLPRGYEH